MCQAIRDGGRRCPVHRHSSIGLIKAVTAKRNLLNRTQVEKLFIELRREGSTSSIPNEIYEILKHKQLAILQADESLTDRQREDITAQFALGGEHDQTPDSGTIYAFSTLASRAKDREASLRSFLNETAERTGYTFEEVQERFKTEYEAVPTGRGAETPAEYNQNTRRRAVLANLPYDRASVTAIEKLKAWNPSEETETVRRITLAPAGPGRSIESWGYHEGRLEIKFYNQEQVQAYHNVPTSVWENMQSARYPNSGYLQYIRNHDEYQYASQEAADNDATAYRCVNCGQFRSPSSHNCPEILQREELVSLGATSEEATAALTEAREAMAANAVAELPVELQELQEEIEENPEEPEESTAEAGTPNVRNAPRTLARPELSSVPAIPETAAQQVETTTYDDPNYMTNDALMGLTNEQGQGRSSLIEAMFMRRDEINSIKYSNVRIYTRESYGRGVVATAEEHNRIMAFFNSPETDTTKRVLIDSINHNLIRMFNSNQIHATTAGGYGEFALRPITSVFSAERRTAEEAAEEERAFNAQWTESSDDDVVNTVMNRSSLDCYRPKFHGYMVNSMRVPNSRTMNSALKNGKVLASSIQLTIPRGVLVTNEGVKIESSETSDVTGHIAIRMRPDGHLEYVGRSLKCGCSEYAEKYYCAHIAIASDSGLKILQKLTKVVPDTPGVVSVPDNFELSSSTNGINAISLMNNYTRHHYNSVRIDVEDVEYRQRMEVLYERLSQPFPVTEFNDEEREFLFNAYNTSYYRQPSFLRAEDQIAIQSALKESEAEALRDNNVKIQIASRYGDRYNVSGDAIYAAGSTKEEATILSHTLRCTCPDYAENYDCEHIRATVEKYPHMHLLTTNEGERIAVNQSREDRNRDQNRIQFRHYTTMIDEEYTIQNRMENNGISRDEAVAAIAEETRLVAEAKERERAMYQEYQNSRLEAWQTVDPQLQDNMESFHETMSDYTRRRVRGENLLEIKTDNVTDGICAPGENTRSFGVELEFDIAEGVDRYQALRSIGEELYEAGLTGTSEQDGYHSSNGTWERWSFEEDCTVAGEIVSPIMKDTPEHWEQLNQVIEIINRNGGVASTNAGCHVNISSGSYGQATAPHAELTRAMMNHEDTIFRLASNPGRGTHRGSRWCRPDIGGIRSSDVEASDYGHASGATATHGHMINYDASVDLDSDVSSGRIEFRMWDATLNTAVIQQQVAISAAFVDYAERRTLENDGRYVADRDAVRLETGTTAARFGRREEVPDMSEEQFRSSHLHVARMFDKLFRTEEQRDSAARLYAMTNNVSS